MMTFRSYLPCHYKEVYRNHSRITRDNHRHKACLPNNFPDYKTIKREFNPKIAENFNFARDVLDKWSEKEKVGGRAANPALWWVDATKREIKWSFEELGFHSRKLANVLSELCQLSKQDRVLLILPRIPEWWLVNIACLRTGTVLLPGTAQLTARDILHRLQTSGAKCVVTDESLAPLVDAVAPQCPALNSKILVSKRRRGGWSNYGDLMSETESASHHNERKFIAFESCFGELFETCPVCKQNCDVQQRKLGTFVAFSQHCPNCQYTRKWQSQPLKGSTPIGNLQMSAGVYFTGASFSQLQKICKAINLQLFQYDTFRRHVRMYLEPAINHKWKKDQTTMLQDLQQKGKIALGGDMRADSPGHSAKFGSYTLMSLDKNKVIDTQLVQSNEVGGSVHMEKEGLRRALHHLQSNHVDVDYIVTDCHPQVQKYLREQNVTQYCDVWHFEKGLSKKLSGLAKNKECQVVAKWLSAIKNHIYWTATSSTTGPEKVAKWTSFVNHIQNVHTHEDPLFPKCAHPDRVSRDPRKWFQPGSMALYKVEKLLLNKRVLRDVAKLSHNFQTSSLETYHNVILRFAPKNVVFPFIGMLCSNVTSDHDCVETHSDDPMSIFFTSGTTGSPKMTQHNHCSFGIGLTVNGKYWLDLTERDVLWNTSDTGWAKSAWSSVYAPWIQGACVFIHHMPRFDTSTVLETLSKFPITAFCTAPTAYRMLVQEDMSKYTFRSLQHCVCAGEPINPEVMQRWKDATGMDIYEGYGQTETVLIAGTFKGMEIKPGSIGKASPAYDVQIVDDEGTILPKGVEGNIGIRVKPDKPFSLFTEYTGDPVRTRECYRADFYLTGDRGFMDEDSYLWFVGRADDVILSAGYRIGPFEVESALIEHAAVAESAVVSSPDPIRGEVVKAFVVLTAKYESYDKKQLAADLQTHVKNVTAPYKYPRKIEFVENLPKTISGKIRRVELRNREWGRT